MDDDPDDDGTDDIKETPATTSVSQPSKNEVFSANVPIVHSNYPALLEVYKDPESQLEVVNMVVSLPGGAKNPRVELNEMGSKVQIQYEWTPLLFDFENLFKKPINEGKMQRNDPRILSFKSGLEKVRSRIDVAPVAKMEIDLPIPVQTTPGSWENSGAARQDGSLVVLGKFQGLAKEYNKRVQDTQVKFDL